jgi:Zn ribbon nucleic-acid-binding protein
MGTGKPDDSNDNSGVVLGRQPSRADMYSSARLCDTAEGRTLPVLEDIRRDMDDTWSDYDYHEPSYNDADDFYRCPDCGTSWASSNEEEIGYCRHCADREDEERQRQLRASSSNQPDFCPRCGAQNPEVVWQTYLVSEPTIMVQCVECGFHNYGIARSRREGRKEWELRRAVITDWNNMHR